MMNRPLIVGITALTLAGAAVIIPHATQAVSAQTTTTNFNQSMTKMMSGLRVGNTSAAKMGIYGSSEAPSSNSQKSPYSSMMNGSSSTTNNGTGTMMNGSANSSSTGNGSSMMGGFSTTGTGMMGGN